MQTLSPNWITEKHIDLEYKKYLLLAYLQEVSRNFDETRLYPFLADLVDHYRSVLAIRENKQALYKSFSERLTRADVDALRLYYEKMTADDAVMQELESIISYSIPQFEASLREGKKIYDLLEEQMQLSPVGITPIHTSEGYLLLKHGKKREIPVYEYQITVFSNAFDQYRAIHTHHVDTYEQSISNTFENIKDELVRYYRHMPNPAAFVISSDMELPTNETMLPIAKRMLVKYVSKVL